MVASVCEIYLEIYNSSGTTDLSVNDYLIAKAYIV